MPTPISPLLSTPAATGPAAAKAATPAPQYQFQHALVRQIEQRQIASKLDHAQVQNRADAQAKVRVDAQAKAAQADQPATPVAQSGSDADAKTAGAAGTPAEADGGSVDQSTEDHAAAPSALSDMLTLVASLQQAQPLASAAAVAPAAPQISTDAAHARTAVLSGTAAASRSGATDVVDAAAAKIDSAHLDPDGVTAAKSNPDPASGAAPAPKAAPGADAASAALATPAGKTAGADGAAAGNLLAPLQQASVQIAQAATVSAPAQLSSSVGSAAWDQQLGQKVLWMVAGGVQSASLTLNPPDLGPLQVVLSISNDQASASFTSAQPEVRQALEAALPKLREMMSEAGINLGNASVSGGMPDQNQAADREQRMNERTAQRGAAGVDGDEAAPRHGTASVQAAALRGLVDTFA
jgi:flagellar hook-length control protein FliK